MPRQPGVASSPPTRYRDMPSINLVTRPLFLLRRLARRLWVRTTLIAALAVVSAAIGAVLGQALPGSLTDRVSADAVGRILEILASSMLAVTTFSLSVMVMARQWASNQSTPRAHRLVQEDPVTQNALATFLGAFLFALASLILVETGVHEGRALTVVLGFTVAVIILVVIAILRWIDHLSHLGGVSETAGRIEAEARRAIDRRTEFPCLGGRPCTLADIPTSGRPVTAISSGYIQHVDAGILNDCAETSEARVWIAATPGTFVTEGEPLVRTSWTLDEDRIRAAFVIGEDRSFDQDPRFGLQVLSEIAQRALSPGVNDPGTAISVIGRLLRLLLEVPAEELQGKDVMFPRVFVPPISAATLIEDAFAAIARDAADKVEVHLAVQTAFSRLAASDNAAMSSAAREASRRGLEFAHLDLRLEADRDRVTAMAPAP